MIYRVLSQLTLGYSSFTGWTLSALSPIHLQNLPDPPPKKGLFGSFTSFHDFVLPTLVCLRLSLRCTKNVWTSANNFGCCCSFTVDLIYRPVEVNSILRNHRTMLPSIQSHYPTGFVVELSAVLK